MKWFRLVVSRIFLAPLAGFLPLLVLDIATGRTAEVAPTTTGRYALLVGCTRYPSLIDDDQLVGPGNDVRLMRTLLMERFEFSDTQIVMLCEAAASVERRPLRANIEREFRRLAALAKPGDQIVILLAGHGSQQPDDHPGDPQDPEPDGFDEVFLPADIGPWTASKQCVENAIPDDEIRRWLDNIRRRGAFVWIVIDSCHSGTMTRGLSGEKLRRVPPERLVPQDVLAEVRRRAAQTDPGLQRLPAGDGALDLPADQAGLVALYATQADEYTVEMPLPPKGAQRTPHGLLTYAVSQVLMQARSPLTYRELAQGVHDQHIRWNRSSPTPLLAGTNLDREVLGQVDWQGRSRFLLRRAGDTYSLGAGALHGLTAGSILQVRPPAGSADPARILGHVRIQAVKPLACELEPCEHDRMAANRDLPPNADCTLVFQDFGDFRLRVAVDPQDAHGLPVLPQLAKSLNRTAAEIASQGRSLVTLVDSVNDADWRLCVDGDQVYLSPAVDEAAGIGVAASCRFGPVPVNGQLAGWLDEQLQRIARAHNLLNLDTSPAPTQALDVGFRLMRHAPEQPDGYEEVKWDSGYTLHDREIVQFRVQNNDRKPIHVTLLYINSDYGIEPFFPEPGSLDDNRVEPGVDFLSPRACIEAADRPEHLVLIAVRAPDQAEPIDFSCLAQPSLERARGVRAAPWNSPLGQLLLTRLYAEGRTRGQPAAALDHYAVRRITWRVQR